MKPLPLFILVLVAGALLAMPLGTTAAPFTWSGASGTDLNWSTPGNWSPSGPPGAGDDAQFLDAGATNDTVSINNIVSADTTVQSLWYGQTANGDHNMLIDPGVTLTLAGTNSGHALLVGTEAYDAIDTVVNATIFGPGGTLAIDNPNADLFVRQTYGSSGSHAANLDLSGLDNFTANLSQMTIAYGDTTLRRATGNLLLARTNIITLSGSSPQILVNANHGNNNGNSTLSALTLGVDNRIFADTITIAADKSRGEMSFGNEAGSLYMRGSDGTSPVSEMDIGDNSQQGGTSNPSQGAVDLSNGKVDILADTINLGRGQTGSGSGSSTGTLTLGAGTLEVNTLVLGDQIAGNAAATVSGTVEVGNNNGAFDPGATLKVNSMLELSHSAGSSAAVNGTLNIDGGTVLVAGDIVNGRGASGGAATINVNTGVLDMQPAGDPTAGNISADTVTVGQNGTAVITNAASISAPTITIGFGGAIAGNTSIDLGSDGTGMFDASGAGSFTLNGTLQGAGSVSGDFVQAPGAAIDPSGTGLYFNSNLTLNEGTLAFALPSSASGANNQMTVYGTLDLAGTNDVIITATEGDLDTTTPYTLITYYGPLIGDATDFRAVGPLGESRRTFSFSTNTPYAITMTVGGSAPAALTWVGDGTTNNWDLKTTSNWNNGVSADQFYNLDTVLFDDNGSSSPAINLVGTLAPGSITVSNATKAYTFSGSGTLAGNPSLTKQGAADLTIANAGANVLGAVTNDDGSLTVANTGADSFDGLTVNGGSITIANGQPNVYAGDIALNGGSLTLNLNVDTTLTNSISGPGNFIKQDTNVLVMTGDNSGFGGTIMINAGTLKVETTPGVNQDSTALGVTNVGTVIANGATLDVKGYNLELEPVTVSGAGVGGEGAIVENTGDPNYHSPGPDLAYVTLVGDTTFGGTGRLDFRSNPSSGTNAAFYTGGQPYKITLVGTNQIQFTGVQIDPAQGDIDVQQGTLGIETSTTLGNGESNLFVRAGSRLLFYQLYSPVEKHVLLFGDGSNDTIYVQSSHSVDQNTLAGPIDINGNCLINVGSGNDLTFSNVVNGTGGLTLTGSGTLHLTGLSANTWSGGLTINAGTLQVGDGSADGSLPATAITNNGALIFNSANDIVQSDPISGTGTLTQNGPGKLTLSGTQSFSGATTVDGGTLQVDGSLLGGGGITVSGGMLTGTGTILGSVDIQSGSTLAPGDSIGTMNVIGALTLDAGGTNVMDLNKSGGTLTNDMISGISSLTLGGTLMLNITGDPLAVGDQFHLYSATITLPSTFGDIEPPQPGPGLAWDTSELTSQGILKVVSTQAPKPTITGISLSGTTLNLAATNGAKGGQYVLLGSTNVALPLHQWTPLFTNTFDGSGAINLSTNIVNPAEAQKFYILSQ